MNVITRRTFLGEALAAGAVSLVGPGAFGFVFDEKGRIPEGVDPNPVFTEDLAADDPRLRQNQFIPAGPRDAFDFRFGGDGAITFLQVTDVHLAASRINSRDRANFARICAETKPSFAVLTGDNVESRCRGAFEAAAGGVLELFTANRLPFAVTFGNHDTEAVGTGWYTAAEQWEIYRRLAKGLFIDRHDPGVRGGGVSRIDIGGADGKPRFHVCVMDSGDHSPFKTKRRTFDSVRAPSVAWARETLADGVPALFFQHIIVPETNDPFGRGLFRSVREGEKGVVGAQWKEPYVLNERRAVGTLAEGCGSMPVEHARDPLYLSRGQSIYDVWKAAENFRGAYFGHDHKNTFDGVTLDGVRLGVTKTATTCGYNDGDLGVRVFRVHEDGTYETDVFSERHPHGTGFWGRRSPLA